MPRTVASGTGLDVRRRLPKGGHVTVELEEPGVIYAAGFELPTTGKTPFEPAVLADVPTGNLITISIPAGSPVTMRYRA